MDSKPSSFFKPSSSCSEQASPYPPSSDVCTYSRRSRKSELDGVEYPISSEPCLKTASVNPGTVVNKKRSYVQLHLEFGQSDFNFRICPICGFNYTPGDEKDEKEHKAFHRNYTHGITFRGWQSERVIPIDCSEGDRIILVSDSDPSPHKPKVNDVIKMMEIELSGGWILHALCKVYLYVSSNRIAGCLVAEPIKEAFQIISSFVDKKAESGATTEKDSRSKPRTLKFGDVVFKREAVKKIPSATSREAKNVNEIGAILCEEKAVTAACGIRAIWVTPSNRRKGVATQLLEAARKSFCTGCTLKRSQMAFSPPTSAGRPLAFAYVGKEPLLLYKADPVPSNCRTAKAAVG